ncbi:DUF4328 domain-containing protein [Micromonospora sp. NPDC050397]|uniref:DUF4328 domain-containing protein n=1 Tax=Micromonospora sp. NPDC050397 TaxID=3364279 RepID=UPI00384FA796
MLAARLTKVTLVLWAAVGVLRATVAIGHYEDRIVTVTHDSAYVLPAWLVYALLPRDFATGGIDVVWAFATLLLLSAFVTWLHQARRHAERLGAGLEWSPRWAIGGWFVPVANLTIPYLVVRALKRTGEPRPRWVPVVPLASWWAGVLTTVGLNILIWLHGTATSRDGSYHGTLLDTRALAYSLWVTAAVAAVVTAVLTMRVVRRLTEAQQPG